MRLTSSLSAALLVTATTTLAAPGPAARPRTAGPRAEAPASPPRTCVEAFALAPEANPMSANVKSRTSGGPQAPVTLESATALRLDAIAWDLRVQGTMVNGTLEAMFAASDVDGTVLVGIVPAPGLRVGDVEVSADGQLLETRAEEPLRPERDAARTGPRPSRESSADPRRLVEVTASAGVPLVARFEVEASATFRSGVFALELDHVATGCESASPSVVSASARILVMSDSAVEPEGEASHPVEVEEADGGTAFVFGAVPGGKDERAIRIAWRLAAGDEESGDAWSRELRTRRSTGELTGESEVAVVVTAPRAPKPGRVRTKDVVFVVDTSGSMGRDDKMVQAREALQRCIASLRDGDAVNVVRFSDDFGSFAEAPLKVADARGLAANYVTGLSPRGGTLLEPALRTALDQLVESEGHRLVVLVSDGILGDEEHVNIRLRANPADARLLVIAIGADAKLDTLQRLAQAGRGEAVVARSANEIVAAMTGLVDTFGAPVAWDLTLDWGAAAPTSVSPSPLPDLYASRPLALRAVFDGPAPSTVRLVGSTVDGPGTFDMRLAVVPEAPAER